MKAVFVDLCSHFIFRASNVCLLCFLGSHRSRCEIVVQKRTNRPVKENDNTSCSIVGIRASMSKLTELENGCVCETVMTIVIESELLRSH
uniref:Uncharacterized protein n=1 Tax=Physcomitrium patens TaxID=3218 RepID=A0A2K1KWD3_PHYPA|nr:hypothetical protein PHYPA_005089 [Physcomitrium patens]